jgi:hypothetical protein
MEEWRAVAGFEGYEVSSEGRVRSLDRYVECLANNGKMTQKYFSGRIRVLRESKDGYLCISLYHMTSKKNTTHKIHRLVAEAFIPKVEGKPEVDHINTNKLDNSVSNLRWADDYDQQANNEHRKVGTSGLRHIYKRAEGIYRVVIERRGAIIRSGNLSLEEAKAFRDSTLLSYTAV